MTTTDPTIRPDEQISAPEADDSALRETTPRTPPPRTPRESNPRQAAPRKARARKPTARKSVTPGEERGIARVQVRHGLRKVGQTAQSVKPSGPGRKNRVARNSRFAWLRRRGWLIAVCLLAGVIGGALVANLHHTNTYTATTTLEVPSGASAKGPGSASDAEALAITYAALLPSDDGLLNDVADELRIALSTVQSHLSASAVAGTAIVHAQFSAPTAAAAVKGADAVADVISGKRAPGEAIASGSVAIVDRPATASEASSSLVGGLILGALLGLVIGIGIALITERSDRRIDDVDALGDATGTGATQWPGGLSDFELACGIERDSGAVSRVTVVPMRAAQAAAARKLADSLENVWWTDADRVQSTNKPPAVTVTPAAETAPPERIVRGATVVLVVGPGERSRAVSEFIERLQLVTARPAWSVLAVDNPGATNGNAV